MFTRGYVPSEHAAPPHPRYQNHDPRTVCPGARCQSSPDDMFGGCDKWHGTWNSSYIHKNTSCFFYHSKLIGIGTANGTKNAQLVLVFNCFLDVWGWSGAYSIWGKNNAGWKHVVWLNFCVGEAQCDIRGLVCKSAVVPFEVWLHKPHNR